jgi:methylase of polypeptide subunit release factors
VDKSARSITLAQKNLRRNVAKGNLPSSALDRVQFLQADVLCSGFVGSTAWKGDDLTYEAGWNILVANPPYISPEEFIKNTSRSVRNWEPRLALVPCAKDPMPDCKRGDEFYPVLLAAATQARCQLVALEVADLEQAKRVVSMARESGKWKGVEIWRDWVDHINPPESFERVENGGQVAVWGEGNGRVVICWSELISTPQELNKAISMPF